MGTTARPRGAPEMVPIEHETSDRIVRTIVFAVPPAALVTAAWLTWGGALRWHDLVVLAITYTLTGLGITVGSLVLMAACGMAYAQSGIVAAARRRPEAASTTKPSRRVSRSSPAFQPPSEQVARMLPR